MLVATAAEVRLNISPTNPMPFRKSVWDPAHCRAEESRTIADRMTHEEARTIMRRIASMAQALEATAAEIAAWGAGLDRVADWDAPAAVAIRNHLDALTDKHARILGSYEAESAKINKKVEEAVEAEIRRTREAIPKDIVVQVEKLLRQG